MILSENTLECIKRTFELEKNVKLTSNFCGLINKNMTTNCYVVRSGELSAIDNLGCFTGCDSCNFCTHYNNIFDKAKRLLLEIALLKDPAKHLISRVQLYNLTVKFIDWILCTTSRFCYLLFPASVMSIESAKLPNCYFKDLIEILQFIISLENKGDNN